MITEYRVGDVVRHVLFGRCATVETVGRKYLTVRVHLRATR